MGGSSLSGGFVAMLFRICLRSLQLIMALVVLGMYGTDLNEARKQNKPGNVKWVRTLQLRCDDRDEELPQLTKMLSRCMPRLLRA
jgi:hypothetical protein